MSTPTNRGRTRARDERGTAIVEFALVLPILLVIVLGTLDLGKAFNNWIDATHLANEAARYAAVNKSPSGSSLEQAILNQAMIDNSNNTLDVCVKHTGSGGAAGQPVEVKVEFRYDPLSFLVTRAGLPSKTVRAAATMRLEVAYKGDGTDAYVPGIWKRKNTPC